MTDKRAPVLTKSCLTCANCYVQDSKFRCHLHEYRALSDVHPIRETAMAEIAENCGDFASALQP